MKWPLSILLVLSMCLAAPAQSIQEVRKQFHQAVLNPEKITPFYQYITNIQDTLPTVIAYQAAAEAMLAQTLWNPLAKFSQVSRFDKLIEKAINKDTSNLEIHFLRFAIQFHLPRILMMSKHLEEDRDFIIENLWMCEQLNIDPDFERYITYFMNETGMLLPDQVQKIKATLSVNPTE